MFEVKFGTPKPVMFRECLEKDGFYMDLDLFARFAGKFFVSEYDSNRYEDEKAVDLAIKSNSCEIIANCLNEAWPEGTSKVRGCFKGLEELFDREIENYGIKGTSEFVIKSLTPDSEKEYKDHMNLMYNPVGTLWDRGMFDNMPTAPSDGKFQVKFSCTFMNAKGGQVFYAPGEPVEVEYSAVASDTSYTFNVNAPDVKYEYGSTIKIKFTMPEHDVMISVSGMPHGPSLEQMEESMKEWIAKGMVTCDPSKQVIGYVPEKKEVNADEWICPACNSKNTGKFCGECGTAKPDNSKC